MSIGVKCDLPPYASFDPDNPIEGQMYCDGAMHFKVIKGRIVVVGPCSVSVMEDRIKRMFKRSFENFESSLQEKAVKKVKAFIKKVLKGEKGYLILMGITGCGKTHLAMAAANEFILAGMDVQFLRYLEFANLIREVKKQGSLEALERVINADVFILDDLGSSSTTDSFLEGLQYVLDRRDGRPVIITTNLNKEDLKEVVGAKIYSRLLEYGVGVALNPIDYRQRRF